MTKYAFFNDQIVPIEEAKISIMNHTFNYGTGCFEGIRAYWNEASEQLYIFRLAEHYERLINSSKYLHITLPYDVQKLCDVTVELLKKEGFRTDTYVRPITYKSDSGIGCRLHNLQPGFAMFSVPFGSYVENEEGVKAGVSSWRRNPDASIPARGKINGAYVNSALSKTWAYQHGYDEAIVLNEAGHVAEGSAENIFMLRRGQLITPPITEDILEGITRETLIQLAREEMGVQVIERPIDRSELIIADEIFFCGTGVQIASVVSVDQTPIGNGKMGPLVAELRQKYFDVVRGKNPKYLAWCTPVF
jgi:branched-chain amino acid aminotransferase